MTNILDSPQSILIKHSTIPVSNYEVTAQSDLFFLRIYKKHLKI